MSLRNRVRPGISRREDFPLERARCALLIIDVQTYLTSPPEETMLIPAEQAYFWETAVPRMMAELPETARTFRHYRDSRHQDNHSTNTGGCEVIFTYLQALTKDGRDISLDYKLSGPGLANIPSVDTSEKDLFLPELAPSLEGKGDLRLPKTSCSVFASTNIHYVLQNLGVEQLVVTGQLTDQCVESAVRDAADAGYFVTVVDDACAAQSAAQHAKGLQSMKGFCRIVSAQQVRDELAQDHQSS